MSPADLHAVPPPPEEPPPRERPAWRQGPARRRLLDDERAAWTREPRARRLLVAAFAALVLTGATALWFVEEVPLLLVVVALTLPPMVVVIGSLNLATRGTTDLRDDLLDERQLAARARAHRTAYRLATGGAAVAYGVLVGVAAADALPSTASRWLAPGYAAFVTVWLLPTLVVAWTDAD